MKNKLIELLRKLLLPEGAIILTRAEVEALNRYEEKRKETADVAPVVRCKDCKKCDRYYPEKKKGEEPSPMVYECGIGRKRVLPTHYCSYGERREE